MKNRNLAIIPKSWNLSDTSGFTHGESGVWTMPVYQGLTPNKVIEVLNGLGIYVNDDPDWDWDDDRVVVHNDRDPNRDGSYLISFQQQREAGAPRNYVSAKKTWNQKIKGITLLERLLLEVYYYLLTGKHLDKRTACYTVCSGSRIRADHICTGTTVGFPLKTIFVPAVDWAKGDVVEGRCHSSKKCVNIEYYQQGDSLSGGVRAPVAFSPFPAGDIDKQEARRETFLVLPGSQKKENPLLKHCFSFLSNLRKKVGL